MKSIILSFILFFCISLFSAEMTGKVVSVADGDTITIIENLDNGRFKIRLYGIDAPEKKQDFGQRAKQHLSSLIFNKVVKIKFTEIDRYGRIVGKIFLNDIEINIEMLKAGMAWHYSRYDQTSTYITAEKQARKSGIGLWSMKNPIPPWNFRRK
jgi:endonuclease YncB( thermonuclease family)